MLFLLWSPAPVSEGQALLDRVSQRVHANIRNMPRYTCEEAIERSWYTGKTLERSDRIRLDVAIGSTGEMFAWHGDRGFQAGAIDELIKSGPISSGTFSAFLANIFNPGAAQVKFTGVGNFTYAISQKRSTFQIGNGASRIITGYDGSFTAEPDTARLLTMRIHSDSLPKEVFMSSLEMQVSYIAARLGEADVELPSTVMMDVTDLQRGRTRSLTTYRNCHQFLTESVIRFDDGPAEEQGAGKISDVPFSMPDGREVAIRINSNVQPESAWAGDRVEGLLLSNIKGVAEKGAKLLGHLIRVEAVQERRSAYNIDLVFDEIVIHGATHPIRLKSATPISTLRRDRTQLTVTDGGQTGACRFRLTDKRENLKGAFTTWKSVTSSIGSQGASPVR